MRSRRYCSGFVLVLGALALSVLPADARRALGEAELDATNAAGQARAVEVTAVPALEVDPTTPLVINQVAGDNQVLTGVRIVVGPDPAGLGQDSTIAQGRDERRLPLPAGLTLDLGGIAQRDLMAAVVNNLLGANQLTTSVNVNLMLAPLALGAAGTGLGSPGGLPTDTPGGSAATGPQGVSGNVLRIGTSTFAWPTSADQMPRIYDAAVTLVPSLANDADFLRAVGRVPSTTVTVPTQPSRVPSTK